MNGKIRMTDVRHTYLHYMIEPLLYARANAMDRTQPILKEMRDAPLEFRYRSDTVPLTIECLIKAIEARTMDTGVPEYKIPAGVDRSRYAADMSTRGRFTSRRWTRSAWPTVNHDMTQGFVLTQYFYEQLIQFEQDPASLKDTIGEMVYSMDVDQQVHRARADRVRQGSRRRCADAQQAAQADRAGSGRGAAGGRRRGHGERHGAAGAGGARRHAGVGRRERARELHPGAGGDS